MSRAYYLALAVWASRTTHFQETRLMQKKPLSVTVCNPYIPANEYRQGVVEALECIGPFLTK